MKRIILLISAAIAIFSCNKDELISNRGKSVVNGPAMVIRAHSPEEELNQELRSVLSDGTKVLWENGDKLSLYDGGELSRGAEYSTSLATPSQTADFSQVSGTPAAIDGKYYACYPKSDNVYWRSNSGNPKLSVIFPTVQHAVVNSFAEGTNYMAAVSDNGVDFHFNHLGAYLRFDIVNETSPSDIVSAYLFRAESGESASGRLMCTVTNAFKKDGVYDGDNYDHSGLKKSYVHLKNSDDSAFVPGKYYISVPAQSDPWNGLKMIFVNESGKVASIVSNNSFDFSRGKIQPVGTVRNLSFKGIGDPYENGSDKGVLVTNPEILGDGSLSAVIISAAAETKIWASASAAPTSTNTKSDNGEASFEIIKGYSDWNNDGYYPAARYCADMGEGWYLPASNELLSYVRNLSLGSEAGVNAFNNTLSGIDGSSPLGTWADWSAGNKIRLWSSTTNSAVTNFYFAFYKSGSTGNLDKYQQTREKNYQVRCCKKVTF